MPEDEKYSSLRNARLDPIPESSARTPAPEVSPGHQEWPQGLPSATNEMALREESRAESMVLNNSVLDRASAASKTPYPTANRWLIPGLKTCAMPLTDGRAHHFERDNHRKTPGLQNLWSASSVRKSPQIGETCKHMHRRGLGFVLAETSEAAESGNRSGECIQKRVYLFISVCSVNALRQTNLSTEVHLPHD